MLRRAADPGGRAPRDFLAAGNSSSHRWPTWPAPPSSPPGDDAHPFRNSDADFVRALYASSWAGAANAEVNPGGPAPVAGRIGVALNFKRSAEFLSTSIASIYGPSSRRRSCRRC